MKAALLLSTALVILAPIAARGQAIPINNLPPATVPTLDTDLMIVGQNNVARKVTLAQSGFLRSGNVNLSGTITINPNVTWLLPGVTFHNQTTSQKALWEEDIITVGGTLGCGTLCVRAPEYDIQTENVTDTVAMSNGSFVANHHNFLFFGPSSGGLVDYIFDMRQKGPITPDVTVGSQGGIIKKQSSIGTLNLWLTLNDSAGGSVDNVAGLIRPFGLAYGGASNPKLSFAGSDSAGPGAAMWAAGIANGEVDIGIEPSWNSVTMGGSVTIGDTVSITIMSPTQPGFGTITHSAVAQTNDTLGLLTQRLCGLVKHDLTLQANGVGAGCYGASDNLLPNQFNVGWPAVSQVTFPNGFTDVTLSTSTSIGATETMTLGAQVTGASVRTKAIQTWIELKSDGDSGFGNSAAIYVGKQSNGAGWSSGGWRVLFEIGGGGPAPFDDTDSSGGDIEPSQYPMRFDADMWLFVPETNVSGAPDGPIPNISLHSFLDAHNVDFFAAAGGGIILPGYMNIPNGGVVMGSGSIRRLTGNASRAGLAFASDGWEGTAVVVSNGGGSGGGTADPTFLLNRYYPGDRCYDMYGGGYQVLTTNSTGGVVTFSVINDGTSFAYPSAPASVSPPASIQPVVGCSGSNWTNAITWTHANDTVIGTAGGTVEILGTSIIAGTISPGTLVGPVTLSGALVGGQISGTDVSDAIVITTHGTASLTLADRFNQEFNVMDFGALGDDSHDDTSNINATFTAAKAWIAAGTTIGQSGTGTRIVFPPPPAAYKILSPINATGLVAYPSTSPVDIDGYGAFIDCQVASKTCFDMIGDTGVTLRGLEIRPVGFGGTYPTTGIQLGRITTVSADRNSWIDLKVVGSTTVAACYIEGSEQTALWHPICYNSGTADSHALYLDASNHANIQSDFVTITNLPNNNNPFNDLVVIGGELRNSGANHGSTVMMTGWMFRPRLLNTYVLNQGTNNAAVELYTSPQYMSNVQLDIHAEQGTGTLAEEVLIDGTTAAPVIHGFKLNEDYTFANSSILALGGSVTSVTLTGADIEVDNQNIGTIPLFDTAANYKVYGDVVLPAVADWAQPAVFAGRTDLGVASFGHRIDMPTGGAQNGNGYRINGVTVLQNGTTDPTGSIFVGGNQTTTLTTGNNEATFGVNAGANLTSGSNVTAIGKNALAGDTTGSGNTALGFQACNSASFTGQNNVCVGESAGATLVTGNGNIIIGPAEDVDVSNSSGRLTIGGVIGGSTGAATHPSVCVIGAPCVIGVLRGADFNVTTDQVITIQIMVAGTLGHLASATKYKITDIFATNCSLSMTTAQGGFYTAALKTGTIVGAITTPYTGCQSSTTQQDATNLTNMNTAIFTGTQLFFSLTTPQGAPATGDVYVMGVPFN